MKMKSFLMLCLTLSTFSVFASDIKIPDALLKLHTAACPEFADAERGEYMQRSSFKMPGTEYGPGPTMYLLGCEMYAYNSMEKAYLVDNYGTIETVAVADVGADGSIMATTNLMGAGYDEKDQTLGTFSKGRGIGDCGASATYKYDAMNSKFVLIEARVKDTCDGEFESEWPVVYKK